MLGLARKMLRVVGKGASIHQRKGSRRQPSPSRDHLRRAVLETLESRQLLSITFEDPTYLVNPVEGGNTSFGQAIATHGSLLAVGAPDTADRAGAVYVFDTASNTVLTIANPDPQPGDMFGSSLAFAGNTLVVGATNENVGGLYGVGEAYAFNSTSGQLFATIHNPQVSEFGTFGQNIVAYDEQSVLINANYVNGLPGVVYKFSLAQSGDIAQPVMTFSSPDQVPQDGFGAGIAVSADGSILIGANGSTQTLWGAGQAYLYDAAGVLRAQFADPTPAEGAAFGQSVAFLGSSSSILIGAPRANVGDVVGAGVVYRFDGPFGLDPANNAAPLRMDDPDPYYNESFGWALLPLADGQVAISAPAATQHWTEPYEADPAFGEVYVWDANTGVMGQRILNPGPDLNYWFNYFGNQLALLGNTLVVSDFAVPDELNFYAGRVYLFQQHVEQVNLPPVADAGADQTANEGSGVLLDGSASFAQGNASLVSYEWDLNNDGIYDDAAGATVVFAGSAPGTYTVGLRVTDSNGLVSTDTVAITVNNVAPVVSPVVGPSDAVREQKLTFDATFADPGDVVAGVWNFGDGTVISFDPRLDPAALTQSHAYSQTGQYTVTLSITDASGATTTVSHQVNVAAIAMVNGDLFIGGTSSIDGVMITPGLNGGVRVWLGGEMSNIYNPTGKILIYGGDGDDVIMVATSIGNTIEIHGGAGNDVLKGGGGVSILVGGDGDDVLMGSTGRDLLIGGGGADTLFGGNGEDILVAGTTSYDNDPAALAAIMAEWTSGRDYATRVANIQNGTGSGIRLNGDYFFQSDVTVFDDGAADVLAGQGGLDWYFANLDGLVRDRVQGVGAGEYVNDVDLIQPM